jgi:hypothetical protein
MKSKTILISLIVLALALPIGLANAQEATEEAPIVEVSAHPHPIRDILREVMDIVTEATGLSQEEVLQQLRDGATLSEIITANGGDVEAIKAEVTTLITERIETAVSDGRITQERADEMLANLPDRISQAFDEVHSFEGRPFNRGERGVFGVLVQSIETATGLTGQEIAEQVLAGSTLSEIITANGGDVEAVKVEAMALATEAVNERLANGQILTQEEADAILVQAEEQLDGWLSGELEYPLFDRPFGGGERGGNHGGRGNGGNQDNGQNGN